MKQELRERLGKATHAIWQAQGGGEDLPPFEAIPEPFRVYFMDMGEAAVKAFIEVLMLGIVQAMLTPEEVKRLITRLDK